MGHGIGRILRRDPRETNRLSSSHISAHTTAARDGVAPAGAAWAPAFLAVAALLKSAQFPMHGWLTEVIYRRRRRRSLPFAACRRDQRGRGFLLIRFADVMLLAPGVLAVLVMVGGFTAPSAAGGC